MLIGYARVSTLDQKLDLQLDALRRAGVESQYVWTDMASGAKSDRVGVTEMLQQLREGDVVVVWRLDRLARSLSDLIAKAKQIEKAGAGLRSLSESIDTTTAGGRLIFHVMGALAEFERQLIVERTKAGMQAARERGMKFGPKPDLSEDDRAAILVLLRTGMTWGEIAKRYDVCKMTLYRAFPGGKAALEGVER